MQIVTLVVAAFFMSLALTIPALASVKVDDTRPATVRQRLLMDFGWRFALGNARDPSKDFGTNTGCFSYFANAGYGDGAVAFVNGLEAAG